MSFDKKKDIYRLSQRSLACENIRFEVFLDDIESQNQKMIRNYLVVAPRVKNDELITGVAVLPEVNGKLGLLRIYRHAIQRYLWEIPRGFVDAGESDRGSALRELEEETGLVCTDANLESLGIFAPEPGVLAARVHLFAAHHCRVIRPFGGEEFGHQEFRLFDPMHLPALCDTDEIQDSSTLIAWLRLKERLSK